MSSTSVNIVLIAVMLGAIVNVMTTKVVDVLGQVTLVMLLGAMRCLLVLHTHTKCMVVVGVVQIGRFVVSTREQLGMAQYHGIMVVVIRYPGQTGGRVCLLVHKTIQLGDVNAIRMNGETVVQINN